MNFFISDAFAEVPAAPGGDAITGLLPLVIFGVVLYFLLIRPQVKRQKEHKSLVDSIQKGDEVQTEGGLLGRVTDLGDDYMKVEISDGVEIKMRRGSVAAVLPKGTLKDI